MVLKRDERVCIWGECDNDNDIILSIDDILITTKALNGKYVIFLPLHSKGGPYDLTITNNDDSIVFTDVMYGEVFLALGQSNMEMELSACLNGKMEAQNANLPEIRFFNVPKVGYIDDKVLEENRDNIWHKCVGEESLTMSAVAFFAAKKIHGELNVPIGVIDCYQGGTSICSWLPEEILETNPFGRRFTKEYNELIKDKSDEQYDKEVKEYWEEWNYWNDRVNYVKANNHLANWEVIKNYAGECPWPQPAGRKSVFRPSGCYYTMVRRVTPYTISAMWFYQGETDAENYDNYYELLRHFVIDLRKNFDIPQIPFFILQLPMFIEKGAQDDCTWANMREIQRTICEDLTDLHMICLADCGEFDNIHPVDKQTPGDRLGMLVLEKQFGFDMSANAMTFASVKKQDKCIEIETNNSYGEIVIGEETSNDCGFEISKDGTDFVKASFSIDGTKIIVNDTCDAKYIRYAWTNYGKVRIFNKNGIPFVPFGSQMLE